MRGLKGITISIVLLGTILDCFSQIPSGFEVLKIYPLSNVNWNKENNLEIKPIRQLFEKHDLVVLAESTHFDGATIDAQCMIIKELINSEIINTIYTESSWLNSDNITHILKRKGQSGASQAKNYTSSGKFIHWVDNGFWEYLVGKILEGKVSIVGFDIETTSGLLIRELYEEALKLPSVIKFKNDDSLGFSSLASDYYSFENFQQQTVLEEGKYNAHIKLISGILSDYMHLQNDRRYHQWNNISKYLFWIFKRQFSVTGVYYNDIFKSEILTSRFESVRDSIMANIFLEDYSLRKGVKAIMLVSAYHALANFRNGNLENCCIEKDTHIMGEILKEKLGNKIYNICFVSGSGNWGLNYLGKTKNLIKIIPQKNSLECYFNSIKFPFFYTDLQNPFLNSSSFPMQVVFQKTLIAKWAQIYSGLFFIKKMYPATYLHPKKHTFDYSDSIYNFLNLSNINLSDR